ncbi:MAG: biopolymer transporter ExbD [Deltaproteobacteria bacterium]|nr:MAG: biopolymer transporter ExbD [Deltaproteobacteria bacterium]
MGAKVGASDGFNDINMTPLIDIVLVVLIIMMVNIPIQVNRMGVKLPAGPPPEKKENTEVEQLAVAVYEDGRIALNRKVLIEDSAILLDPAATAADKDELLFPLIQEVSRRLKSAQKKNVFIDAHPNVNYGIIVDMMDLARESGAVNVGLAKLKEAGPLEPTAIGAGVMPRGVIVGSPSVVGYITEKQADDAFKPYLAGVRACYEEALTRNPRLTGRILARVDVQYEGQLMDSKIESSSLKDEEIDECVSEALQEVRFPPLRASDDKPEHERTARVLYPLLFSPG